jgi:hypothetical protein
MAQDLGSSTSPAVAVPLSSARPAVAPVGETIDVLAATHAVPSERTVRAMPSPSAGRASVPSPAPQRMIIGVLAALVVALTVIVLMLLMR